MSVFYLGRDWTMRGNVIRYNFIHHASGPGLFGAGVIYLDDCACGTVEDIIERIRQAVEG